MGGVWRGDRHQINPVRAVPFAFQHFAPVAIGAVGGKPDFLAKGAACGGVMVQRPGGKGEEAVKPGGKAVGRADLAAFAAPDHTPIQLFHGQAPS